MRYHGHCAIMKMLLQELHLQFDQDNPKAILRKSIPMTLQDVVLVFVTTCWHAPSAPMPASPSATRWMRAPCWAP